MVCCCNLHVWCILACKYDPVDHISYCSIYNLHQLYKLHSIITQPIAYFLAPTGALGVNVMHRSPGCDQGMQKVVIRACGGWWSKHAGSGDQSNQSMLKVMIKACWRWWWKHTEGGVQSMLKVIKFKRQFKRHFKEHFRESTARGTLRGLKVVIIVSWR